MAIKFTAKTRMLFDELEATKKVFSIALNEETIEALLNKLVGKRYNSSLKARLKRKGFRRDMRVSGLGSKPGMKAFSNGEGDAVFVEIDKAKNVVSTELVQKSNIADRRKSAEKSAEKRRKEIEKEREASQKKQLKDIERERSKWKSVNVDEAIKELRKYGIDPEKLVGNDRTELEKASKEMNRAMTKYVFKSIGAPVWSVSGSVVPLKYGKIDPISSGYIGNERYEAAIMHFLKEKEAKYAVRWEWNVDTSG